VLCGEELKQVLRSCKVPFIDIFEEGFERKRYNFANVIYSIYQKYCRVMANLKTFPFFADLLTVRDSVSSAPPLGNIDGASEERFITTKRPYGKRKYKFQCPKTMDEFKIAASREMAAVIEEVWEDEDGTKISIEVVLHRVSRDEIVYCATADDITALLRE
jgi:hypothetical protein